MIRLFNKCSFEAMKTMETGQYDLAIIDPPYGIKAGKDNRMTGSVMRIIRGKKEPWKGKHDLKSWDDEAPSKDFFYELQRVSKNQIIFGANHFIENIPKANSSSWLIWDKKNGTSTNADAELAWTSFKSAVRIYRYKWYGFIKEDMKNKPEIIHPTQKPVPLYEWIISKYAKAGDRILDTHLGSGSIAIAAHNLHYNLDGYEVDKDYFKSAKKRINTHQRQLTIPWGIK